MCIKVSFLDTAVFIFRHDAAAMGGACDEIDSADRADMWKNYFDSMERACAARLFK